MAPKQKPATAARDLRSGGDEPPRLRRFIRLREVLRITGLSQSALYDKMSRLEFPRQVTLGDNPRARKQSVAWVESEVAEWMEARITRRAAEPPPKPYRDKSGRTRLRLGDPKPPPA
jgi:prophage regulatory protein